MARPCLQAGNCDWSTVKPITFYLVENILQYTHMYKEVGVKFGMWKSKGVRERSALASQSRPTDTFIFRSKDVGNSFHHTP